jgi:hypothetical protein
MNYIQLYYTVKGLIILLKLNIIKNRFNILLYNLTIETLSDEVQISTQGHIFEISSSLIL